MVTDNQLAMSLAIVTKEVKAKQWRKADKHIDAIYNYYRDNRGAFTKTQEELMFLLLDSISEAIYG